MNSATQRPEKAYVNKASPILSPLPQQLPYPYQTRKVNFNSYSGVKRDTSVKGYDPADVRSKSFAMPSIEHSQSTQRLKSAPANPNQNSWQFEKNELDLSTDGFEVFVDDQPVRPQTQSGRSRDQQSFTNDIVGSENLMWLLDVAEKNSRRESARTSSPSSPKRTTSATVPDPEIVERSQNNQERLEGPILRSAPNARTSVVSSIDYSKTSKPKSAMAAKADRKEMITSKSMPIFSKESLDSEPLLVAPRTVVDEILDDWQQQPYHRQFNIKSNPKTQKLKGVTQDFDEASSTSPYLEHLTTSNPRLGNAATALHKMHHEALGSSKKATISTGGSTPKGFAIVLDENTAIDPDFGKLTQPQPETKYPAHHQQLQPHLSGANLLPSTSSKGLRPTTAQEKVAMFKSSIPDRPMSINARAVHSQQTNWSARNLRKAQTNAGATNLMNTVPSDSLTQDLGATGGNIDRLISSIQFPTQPIAGNALTSSQELLMDGTTVELPFIDALDISLTTADQLAVLHNIHKDPLYRLLREECETLKAEAVAAQVKEARMKSLQAVPGPTMDNIGGSLDKPQATRSHHHISASELKVLKSFKALPPAVWITARIVYFLILSYYECFLCALKNSDGTPNTYRAKLNMEKFWSVLDQQCVQDHMQLSNVMHLYSWPYLHALLLHPVQFIKSLNIIEHGALSKDRNLFFEAFPVEKLDFLRQLVQQGQGLFQETAVITSVPVCAKLCSWAKRVIANIYSSCLARIRLKQHLEDTIPEEYIDGSVTPSNAERGPTDSLEASGAPETADNPELSSSLDRPLSRLSVAPNKLASSLHIVVGIQTALPSNSTDMFAQPLDMSSFQCAMSLTKPMDTLNVIIADNQKSSDYMELEDCRAYYEDCLRKYYTSPFHNVQLLSVAQSQVMPEFGSPGSKVSVSYRDAHSMAASSTNSISSHSHAHSHSSLRFKPNDMQSDANQADLDVHPLILYGMAHAAEVMIVNQWNNNMYPSLINKANRTPSVTPKTTAIDDENERQRQIRARKFLQSGRLWFKFSLAMASNDCSFIAGDQPDVNAGIINNYVVCVKNTKNSWAAFQLACRLSKPSDIITVIHIPEIEIIEEDKSSITSEKYEQQKANAEKRITQLAGIYKTAGFNLYVDDVPDFVDEAQRSMSNYFQKTAMESRLRQADKNITVDNEPRNQFVANQYKFNLVNRILSVASMFKPTFIVLGADSVDLGLAMSSAHKNPLGATFPCKNDVEFSPEPIQIARVPSEAAIIMTPDENDSTGFIYNDNTSYTFDSLGESQLDSPSRNNRTIEAEAALYEGDDDYYEDSFVMDDNNTYGADSFEGEDSNVQYSSTFEKPSSQDVSRKPSIESRNNPAKKGKTPSEAAAANKLNANREHELLQNYVAYSQHKVGVVEMFLHANNELKDQSSTYSVLLANHVKSRSK